MNKKEVQQRVSQSQFGKNCTRTFGKNCTRTFGNK